MTIFERDKERGGDIVITTSTTNDAVAVKNSPALWGSPSLTVCGVAPPRHSHDYSSSSRLAYGSNLDFQNSYYLGKGQ